MIMLSRQVCGSKHGHRKFSSKDLLRCTQGSQTVQNPEPANSISKAEQKSGSYMKNQMSNSAKANSKNVVKKPGKAPNSKPILNTKGKGPRIRL